MRTESHGPVQEAESCPQIFELHLLVTRLGLATYFCMICTDPECMQNVQPQQVMVILIVFLFFVLDTPLFRLPGGRLLRAGLNLKGACKAFSSATTSPTC